MPFTTRAVFLTRRVGFSSGHRYWNPDLNPEQNKALFGPWASPYNHGHNYALHVTISGFCDTAKGMVVNIKSLDDFLDEAIVAQFDSKSLNDEVGEFKTTAPTLENLLTYIQRVVAPTGKVKLDGQAFTLESLKLEEHPALWAELIPKTMKTTLTRSYEFSASHRLHAPTLSDQENKDLFGKCNNPAGHGHNYIIEVTVSGEVNPKTGMLVDLSEMDERVNDLVVDHYDHKNLNVDMPEFANKVPTTEIITLEAFDRLNGKLPAELVSVRIYETARSGFEVRAG